MIKNIAVVAGGDSSEYKVSLLSASNIINELDKKLYNPVLVTIRGDVWKIGDQEAPGAEIDKNDFSFIHNGAKINFECAFITIHGDPGENGKLQGYFDMIKMPYTTSGIITSAVTFNKYICKGFLNNFGIISANAMLIKRGDKIDPERVTEALGLPCFVKPNNGGSSFGITRVKSKTEVKDAVLNALKEDDEVIIEEYIEGIEVTGGVIKTFDREIVLPLTEIVSKNEFFDFNAKYNKESEEITPARISDSLTKECQKISSFIYDLLNCRGIVRFDYILKDNKFYFLELNTIPGMTDTSLIPQQAAESGLKMKDIFTWIIEDSLKKQTIS